MPTPRMKFNPGFRSDEEIVADFLVRHADLELVLRTIRENTGAPRNQHLLLVGPRGMGKTTLVLRVAAEVRSDPHLQTAWYPIVFSEESYSVATPGEFWLEALHHLGHQTGDVQWKRAHEELMAEKDEKRLRERALAKLLDFADQQGKHLLLVVENLQMLMGDQLASDDAWMLREALQNEPRLMLLATATSRFDQIENVDEAMYEQCLVHELKPLDDDECRQFWEMRTGTTLAGRQIRPIRILTGGNPRLLDIISLFAAGSSFEELLTNLFQLVDDHTDYFKGHLDQLAALERKVFVALADIWDPAPTRQVARAARLDTNRTSAELARLTNRGAVLPEGSKRSRRYQVAERMYNIYHLMRRRGDSSARVMALVRFMLAFYGPRELIGVTASVAEEVRTLAQDRALDHLAFLQELLRDVEAPELRFELSNVMRPAVTSLGEALDRRAFGYLAAAVANAGAPRGPGEDDVLAKVDVVLGMLKDPVRRMEAESIARELTDSPSSSQWGWRLLAAAVTLDANRADEAEALWRRVTEFDPLGWRMLATLLSGGCRRYAEAAACYRRWLGFAPTDAAAWRELASILAHRLQEWPEAEHAFRQVVDLDPTDAQSWLALALLLHGKLSRHQDAEVAYRHALELEPGRAGTWRDLGHLLYKNLRRFDEAEAAYRRALEIEPDSRETRALALVLTIRRTLFGAQGGDVAAGAASPRWPLEDIVRLIQVYRDVDDRVGEHLVAGLTRAGRAGTSTYLAPQAMLGLFGGLGDWDAVLAALPYALSESKNAEPAVAALTAVLVHAAAAGYTTEVLTHLQASPSAPLLEPLICALRMDAGEDVSVAQEIMEVARDILDDIQEARKKLASSAEANAE